MNHWTDEAKAYAIQLIKEGHSGGVIARMVNTKFRLSKTRNAIIGIAYRNRLHLKGAPATASGGRPKARKPRKPKNKPFFFGKAAISPIRAIIKDGLPLPPPHETDIARVSLQEAEDKACRWPCADYRDHAPFFCGEPRVPGLPYCYDHVRRAYQPPQPRPRAPKAPAPISVPVLEAA